MSQATGATISRRNLFRLGTASIATAILVGCSPNTTRPVTVNATEQNVRLIGRTYEQDKTTWIPQSGSAIEFLATGTGLKIELAGDNSVNKDADLRPRYAVLVDGKVVLDETLSESPHVVDVPLGHALKDTIVEVIHLSEAPYGIIGVRTIQLESDSPTPIAPTNGKGASIAFVGDSITCAYGVEAKGEDEPFKTTTENFMKSYAYYAAQELGADYETICYNGYGVFSGWSDDGSRNTERLMPKEYERVTKDSDKTWDFAAHPRDIVVVNLGTNDSTYTKSDEARMREFSNAYTEFLGRIRELNPKSLILCTVGTMDCESIYPALEQAVSDHVSRTGDTRTHSYPSAPMNVEEDGCGALEHPNETVQRKIAKELIDAIHKFKN